MKTLNPILVLAASVADSGHSMFARELLSVSRGMRDAKAIKRSSKRFSGLHALTVARIVNDKIQRS